MSNDVTSAEILRNQLADVLVNVPLSVITKLDVRSRMNLMDWCDVAKTNASLMRHVPVPEFKPICDALTFQQRCGEWDSFTHWRPAPTKAPQRSLFGDEA